jgi:hypothetical protein
MRRVIVIAFAGMSLAGCSTFSWDALKPAPPAVLVELDSVPKGADARTSLGPGCVTPCSVTVPVPDTGFTVSYTLNRYLPVTVSVRAIRPSGDYFGMASLTLEPNPVVAQLQPVPPPARPVRRSMKPKRPRVPRAAAAPAAGSPFPEPAQAPASTR